MARIRVSFSGREPFTARRGAVGGKQLIRKPFDRGFEIGKLLELKALHVHAGFKTCGNLESFFGVRDDDRNLVLEDLVIACKLHGNLNDIAHTDVHACLSEIQDDVVILVVIGLGRKLSDDVDRPVEIEFARFGHSDDVTDPVDLNVLWHGLSGGS